MPHVNHILKKVTDPLDPVALRPLRPTLSASSPQLIVCQLPFQLPESANWRLMTMSISEAPEETANFISSNRAVSGVCPAGKPVATTIQQWQKQNWKHASYHQHSKKNNSHTKISVTSHYIPQLLRSESQRFKVHWKWLYVQHTLSLSINNYWLHQHSCFHNPPPWWMTLCLLVSWV